MARRAGKGHVLWDPVSKILLQMLQEYFCDGRIARVAGNFSHHRPEGGFGHLHIHGRAQVSKEANAFHVWDSKADALQKMRGKAKRVCVGWEKVIQVQIRHDRRHRSALHDAVGINQAKIEPLMKLGTKVIRRFPSTIQQTEGFVNTMNHRGIPMHDFFTHVSCAFQVGQLLQILRGFALLLRCGAAQRFMQQFRRRMFLLCGQHRLHLVGGDRCNAKASRHQLGLHQQTDLLHRHAGHLFCTKEHKSVHHVVAFGHSHIIRTMWIKDIEQGLRCGGGEERAQADPNLFLSRNGKR